MIYLYTNRINDEIKGLYDNLLLDTLPVVLQIGGEKQKGSFAYKIVFRSAHELIDYQSDIIELNQNGFQNEFLSIKDKIYSHYGIKHIDYFKVFGNYDFSSLVSKSDENVKIGIDSKYLDTVISLVQYENAGLQKVEEITSYICETYTKYLYCFGNTSLEEAVVTLLSNKNRTVSTAESITGGLIASKLVNVSGASKVLKEGCVTYTDVAKTSRLNVNEDTLLTYTAVSEQTAREMVKGSIACSGADYAVSATGYAETKNTLDFSGGLCYIGVANDETEIIRRFDYIGDRNYVRNCVANTALYELLSFCKKN